MAPQPLSRPLDFLTGYLCKVSRQFEIVCNPQVDIGVLVDSRRLCIRCLLCGAAANDVDEPDSTVRQYSGRGTKMLKK